MKKIMNLKFKKGIQKKLNWLFSDEEYHVYTLGEFLKIMSANVVLMTAIVIFSCL